MTIHQSEGMVLILSVLCLVGIVEVPDARLLKLAEISGSEATLPATLEIVDIAGTYQHNNRFNHSFYSADLSLAVVTVCDRPGEGCECRGGARQQVPGQHQGV
jgi:hypothetical protein